MLKNHIKIAWRNLRKNPSYSFINIFGLAVGMACCIMISLYAKEELSFDRFHANADRIIAVGSDDSFFGESLSTPYPLADTMVDEMSGIEQAIRYTGSGSQKLSIDGQDFAEIKNVAYTEPDYFDIFSFRLLQGNPKTALANSNTTVLSETARDRLFGEGENPLGKSLYLQRSDTVKVLEITGIIEDAPQNSTVQYGALISYNTKPESDRRMDSWRAYSHNTYALLSSPESFEALPNQFDQLVKAHYEPEVREKSDLSFLGIPLTQLHLSELSRDDGFTGNRAYLYIFGSVALFILIIACVNYVNLATARTSLRSQEVGVRKTLGANRGQVAGQFLGESVLLTVISYVFGVVISSLALPYFNQLFGTAINWEANYFFLGWLLFAAVGVGLLAGLYPALYLSGFSPVKVLRQKMGHGPSGSWLRKALVVGQFAIALVLIITALVVYKQLNFTQTKDLGFEGEQIVIVHLPNNESWQLRDNIRNSLSNHSGIKEVSVATSVPTEFGTRLGFTPDKISSQQKAPSDEMITFSPAVVDYEYLNLLNIDLLAGHNFSRDLETDRQGGFIINKKAAEKLGWTPEEAIGNPFNLRTEGEVIGVVENFHIRSLRDKVEPVSLQLFESSSWSSGGLIVAQLMPDQIPQAMDFIENELRNYDPNLIFDYEFLNDKFDALYRTERRLATIISLFTIIAIIIACLGLYGLSAFTAERRTKEIGIRKVLGATVTDIVGLLSKDFLKLVVLGFVVAIPIAWYISHQWLQNFAYRIDIGIGVFALAGTAAVIIALMTINWQSVRTALANPVESLQSE